MKLLLLCVLLLSDSALMARPLNHEPMIPQVCRIAFGVRDEDDGSFKRLALCLGTLIGAEEDAKFSSAVLTAGHCDPQNIFAKWEKGKISVNLACGSGEWEITGSNSKVHPRYSNVAMWLYKKMLGVETGPYPIDLTVIQLRTPIAISPLTTKDLSVREAVQAKDQCLLSTISPDFHNIAFRSAKPLFEETPLPLIAVQETAGGIIKDGDSGGPLLCLESDTWRVAGLNSVRFSGLNASFIQNFTPEISQWLANVMTH